MICMSNLSFYLLMKIPYMCRPVVTSRIDPRHKIVFGNIGSLSKFYNLIDVDFSDEPRFLRTKKIYNDSLLSKLTTDARLLLNEEYPSIMLQEEFFG